MKDQLAEMLTVPTAATRNSGVELEAVVQTTEAAANRIMEVAEAIGDWLQEISADPSLRERITDKVNNIFEACSFQDLTSQRIRRAIDHLHHVESMLSTISPSAKSFGPDLAQAEIDRMMAG